MQKLMMSKKTHIEKHNSANIRFPNLNTIIMVEDSLKKNREIPISTAELKKKLPKQIMHATLKVILEYLWKSGKIIYGPRGIQWIYSEPAHLKTMLDDAMEI